MPSKETWYKILYIFLGIVGVWVFFKYLLPLVAPFVLAWLLACLLNPFVTWLNKYFKVGRGLGTLLSMLTILSAFIGVVALLVQQLWQQIIAFKNAFPIYQEQIVGFIDILEGKFTTLTNFVPLPEAFSSLDGIIQEGLDYISKSLGTIISYAAGVVSSVPNGLFFMIITLISVFFMTRDNRLIREFVKAQMPHVVTDKVVLLQKGLKGALGGYVKTQLILMCYTFGICLIGLFILKREYVLLISCGIALFDALPAFGSGAILIPWGIYHLIIGNYAVGIGLISIYILILIMRQIMEPKVLSSQIGVYALVTVMAMYVGIKTMGVLGIILGPVIVVSFQTLQRVGIIPEFKKVPHQEDHNERNTRRSN